MGNWEAVAVIASCVVAVLAFIDNWLRRKRTEDSEATAGVHRIEDRLTRLETDQFGTNHGGMREQLNKVDGKVDTVDLKVDRMATEIAELRGEIRAYR